MELFLFATHGDANNSEQITIGMNKAREPATGSNIVGTFNCQGEVPENVIESAANKVPQPSWRENAIAAKGQPNNDDLYALNEAMEKAGLVATPIEGEKRMFS